MMKTTAIAALMASAAFTGAAWSETTLTAVMHSGLRVLDPIMTTAHITRNHGYMIYDVLLAQDSKFEAQPQMADWTISDDGLIYRFTLRDGLKFHDGAPVTPDDVIASLNRWSKKDAGGQMMMERTASLEAEGDDTIVWTLKEPFRPMIDLLSKPSGVPAFIMPKRIADTSADESVKEYIGSGPFSFVLEEFQPGLSVTYAKFEDYVPRDEPADGMAGGKTVYLDRVKWVSMSDAMTSANAMATGEIDYLELLQVDLVPLLEGDPDIEIELRDSIGYTSVARLNFLHPPFDNKLVRQAAVKAISQEPIMQSMMALPKYYRLCGSVYGCGIPLETEAGAETLVKGDGIEEAKALLAEAGYDGTPVVLMQPTDVVSLTTQPVVLADQLRQAGFTVDLMPMDWQTLVTRRANPGTPAQGGWNMFATNWIVHEVSSPLLNGLLSGRGMDGWFGWPEDPEMEALREEFIQQTDSEGQLEVAIKVQERALDNALIIPLGQYYNPQARRSNVQDMLPNSVPVFWEMKKVDP